MGRVGAAFAERPSPHYGISLYGAWSAKTLRPIRGESWRDSRIPIAILGRRRAGILRRSAPASRTVYPPGGVHPLGNDGRGLFSGSCAEGILANTERWGTCRALLLRIPLPVRHRRRSLERRRHLATQILNL